MLRVGAGIGFRPCHLQQTLVARLIPGYAKLGHRPVIRTILGQPSLIRQGNINQFYELGLTLGKPSFRQENFIVRKIGRSR